MGGKKKKVTIGYKYFMGLHMGICRGPIDALRQIRVGDKVGRNDPCPCGSGKKFKSCHGKEA